VIFAGQQAKAVTPQTTSRATDEDIDGALTLFLVAPQSLSVHAFTRYR
jgi:hypothetical protein